mgnify:CR=1 FL=1
MPALEALESIRLGEPIVREAAQGLEEAIPRGAERGSSVGDQRALDQVGEEIERRELVAAVRQTRATASSVHGPANTASASMSRCSASGSGS